ncbi:GNAT family N-acetyltransferase (plasmid) [Streptosporangium sp. CA-135522]|uniref:GNAT family N-acetyltransferase n=1 Tax=Streptosporangium sp. CA-135522 TaxID=3240072 RepID=UPI003D8A4009
MTDRIAQPPDLRHFAVLERAYDHAHALRLVRGLFDEQVARYGYADPYDADPAAYVPPSGVFLVGYLGEVPVSCGGYRAYDAGTRILAELERHAVRNGAERAILETGVRNTAALALYRSFDYRPTDRYVDGRDPEINRAFIKDLRG